MSRLDHDRVMGILAQAMELPEPRRASFLDSTCLGEPDLRREVEELLQCSAPADRAFGAAAERMVCPDPDRIGSYEVLEPIGEGGMAVVYKAQQQHPIHRIVAIKLIKLGMDTRQFVARFESERQALAMMDHPNVAKVFDAGSTETGRPYFVMEFVAGRPILNYCDANQLDTTRRLDLFIQVCEAVEHAHRKGIIHRDLKNSNVLVMEVDGKPVPKVIDFGVAKAVSQRLTDRTLQTEQGQLIGTPEYMSPEQAERGMIDVDTRSDVYSLGVLLYELIAGVPPIPPDVLRSAGYEQVQRIIRETEPLRPSTRLSTLGRDDATRVAKSRRTPLPALVRELRHELEWIPLKAMRRDREQRYRSASELADDIRNYLGRRPLIAGPETRAYRVRKFIRRHKTGVAALAVMLLLLIGGIAATTWQAVKARAALREAQLANANSEAVIRFLIDDVIGSADPAIARGRDLTVKEALDNAAQRVGQKFSNPMIEAHVREKLALTYLALGRADLGLPHASEALQRRRMLLGDDHFATLTSINIVARLLIAQGKYAEAEPILQDSVARCRRCLGEDHPLTLESLHTLGGMLHAQGRLLAAEPLWSEVLERRRRLLGDDNPSTLTSANNLGTVFHAQGRLNEAERLWSEALERSRRVLGDDHPQTLTSVNNLAVLRQTQGMLSEAELLYRESLERSRRVLGDDHPATLSSLNNLGHLLAVQGKHSEAEPLWREALERCRHTLGDDHPDTLGSINNLGGLLQLQGRFLEAEALYAELVRRVPHVQLDAEVAATFMASYGPCLAKLGRYQGAEAPLRDAYEMLKSAGLDRHVRMLHVVGALAEVCEHTNRPDEAARWRAELAWLQAATCPTTRPN